MDPSEVTLLRTEVHGLRCDFKEMSANLMKIVELHGRQDHLEYRINQQESRLNRQSEKVDGLMGSSAEHSTKIQYSVHWVQWIIASVITGGASLLLVLWR